MHIATIVGGTLWAAQPADQPAAGDVVVEKNVEARMRDGVVLRADVYRPSRPGRFPVLLQRTTYSKSPGRDGGESQRRLAAQGYVLIVQDTRGRYTSDGVAQPHDEAKDGYDTIEWAATLPYANGKVGMFGASYLATTTLQAAAHTPPHLVAIQPSAAYSSRYDDLVYQGGAFYLADGLSWSLGQAVDVRRRLLTPDAERDGAADMTPAQRTLLRQSWLWHVPLRE